VKPRIGASSPSSSSTSIGTPLYSVSCLPDVEHRGAAGAATTRAVIFRRIALFITRTFWVLVPTTASIAWSTSASVSVPPLVPALITWLPVSRALSP
jgi:hypothetical protein